MNKHPVAGRALAALAALATTMSLPSMASTVLLSENFEDGVLDPRITVTTIGSFNVAPGIVPLAAFGSSQAFGYGLSSCIASCFNNYVTLLTINLGQPTFVGAIQFSEMERYENWGSNGLISIDGSALTGNSSDFGRLPYNDRVPDSTFRTHVFEVNRVASTITLGVYDITRSSEIVIDDLLITAVPEPATSCLLLAGVAALLARRRRAPAQ